MPEKDDDAQLTAEQVLSDVDQRMDRTLEAFRRDLNSTAHREGNALAH